jgi:glycogen synthase
MHIVLANQWFPPESGWGGVGMHNHTIARAYRQLGHEVSVIASRLTEHIPSFHKTDAISVHRLLIKDMHRARKLPALGKYVRSFQQLGYSFRVKRALDRLHQAKPIDVVEFAEVNAEGFFFAGSPSFPYVVRCHTPAFVLCRYFEPEDRPYDARLTCYLERKFIRRTDFLTAPSDDMRRVISRECQIPPDRIRVIPNALDVDPFDGKQAPNSSLMVLHVGRVEHAKGVDVLIDAIPHVAREAPNTRFVFVGGNSHARNGSKRAELEARLRQSGCESKVRFVGLVEQRALTEWYREADICVVPSIQYESFSYTCAQAMAAGKPVVASRIGGIPETVKDGECGFIVAPGNAGDLAQAILLLARNPELRQRQGAAGKEVARRRFDPIRVAQSNLQVYESAIQSFKKR